MNDYSILMAVYVNDSPKDLMACISSMLEQTIPSNDFVIVCDGPLSDELNACLTQFVLENEDIFNIIRLPQNAGLGAALKIGLPFCKNEIIARMDGDDISHVDRCEKELCFLEKHPEVSIVGSFVNEFEDAQDRIFRVKSVPLTHQEIVNYSKRRNPFNHSSVMFRKNTILKMGNYSEMRTNQDIELWVRLLNNGCVGANINESLVDFRFESQTYKRRKSWKNIKLMVKTWHCFWGKHYCSLADFLYVLFLQIIIFIMPEPILRWCYSKLR